MKHMALAVLLLFVASSAGAEVIRVIPLDRDDSPVFKCGERCKFRGAVPEGPIRLRIIRGSIAQLTRYANSAGYVKAGCMELYSTIVRPRRRTNLIDLKFYFSPAWLAKNGNNGEFVFVVERDDKPNGPQLERVSMLRLPAGTEGARYFQAGLDVTILAPVNLNVKPAARPAARPSPPTTGTEMAMTMSEPTAGGVVPAAAPRAIQPTENCVDVNIDNEAIQFRRADAAPARPGPVMRASSGVR